MPRTRKSMSAAERASADSYAGPHHSFPLYSSGAHLRAAWNLAGHSADPEATRARIRAFAAKHGLTGRLPKTAQKGYSGGLGDFSTAPLGVEGPGAPQPQGFLNGAEDGHGDASNAPGISGPSAEGHIPWLETTNAPQPQGALSPGVADDGDEPFDPAGDQPHGFLSETGTVEEQPVGPSGDHPSGEGSYLTSTQGYPGFEGDTQRSSTNSRSRPAIPPQGPDGVWIAGTYSPGRDSNWTRSGRPPIQGQDYNQRSMGSDSFQADDQGGAARNRMGMTPGGRGSVPQQAGARKASITAGLSRGGFGANNTPRGSSRVHQAVSMAYDHAERADGGPDGYGSARSEVIDFAHEHDLMGHLPERAHGYMHRVGHPHRHPGERDEQHVHTVRKAFNVVGKSITIEKAWGEGDECFIEGWVSTNDPDLEKDIVEPEAFKDALSGYAQRRMPLSSEHATKAMPIGHGQRLALVRDGVAFKSTVHPTDPAEFEHFPNRGTGVYGRFVITDPAHASQVKKGNIGGFSWIGNLTEYEPLASGGRRYLKVDPWLESTVAAFPVNSKAVLLAAKAYEAELAPQTNEEVSDLDSILEELLAGAAEAADREAQAEQAVSKADLQSMFGELSKRIDSVVATQVQKAVSQSREGVGRVGGPVASSEPTRDDQPGEYIVRKANSGEELSPEDKALAWGIMEAALSQGLH